MGSSGTLIAGWKLKELVHLVPEYERQGLRVYKQPVPGNKYVCCVDVSEGKGMDYHTFSIIDVTKMPYDQVCTYRHNMTTVTDFVNVMFQYLRVYGGEVPTLVETNIPMGYEAARYLQYDLEYEHVLFTKNAGAKGKRITGGFGENVDIGIKTSKTTKGTGCSMLKLLIEQNQLRVHDFHTISELSTFSRDTKQSFGAEPGCHDDAVMALVLFAWLSKEPYFREMTDLNTLARLTEKSPEDLMNELLPMPIVDDHMESRNEQVSTHIPQTVTNVNDFSKWMTT